MKIEHNSTQVDAIQFVYTPEGIAALREFCGEHFGRADIDQVPDAKPWASIKNYDEHTNLIVTHFVSEGSWIVKTVDNTFRPVSDNIFQQTYAMISS
jgi:hypothetical protein